MKTNVGRNLILILISTIFLLGLIIAGASMLTHEKTLPIYSPEDLNARLVDKSMRNIGENHTVSDFELVNQNGETVTQADYEDKVYVVDFFFTLCPTICPVMTGNLEKVQLAFMQEEDFKLLSISVTPEMDSVPVLREYATKKSVVDSKWNITTGDKKHIYELARRSYFAVVDEGDGDLQDFIHTPNFVLVDKYKQIRGIYNGTQEEEVERLIEDIKILLEN